MKKRLNVESITNELNGGSAFFPNYVNKNSPAPKPQPESTKSAHQTAPTAALASPIPITQYALQLLRFKKRQEKILPLIP
jgi:hypothetical protein